MNDEEEGVALVVEIGGGGGACLGGEEGADGPTNAERGRNDGRGGSSTLAGEVLATFIVGLCGGVAGSGGSIDTE